MMGRDKTRHRQASDEDVLAALATCGNVAAAARSLGIARTTFRRLVDDAKRRGVVVPTPKSGDHGKRVEEAQSEGVEISGDEAVIRSAASDAADAVAAMSPDDLLSAHGLDPDEWIVGEPTLKRWTALAKDADSGGNVVVTMAQLIVRARKKRLLDFALPEPKPAGWSPPKPKRPRARRQPVFIPFIPDPHAPLHEPALCEAVAAWLAEHAGQVREAYCLGDASDNSPWARHRKIPRTHHSMTETVQATYDLLASWRSAVSEREFHLLPGNHDWWIVQRLREERPELESFCLPNDDVPILSPRRMLRLDELGITFHDAPGGEWHDAVVEVLPDLIAMHGVQTGPRGGAVREIAGWETTSVVQGHDHKLGMFRVPRRTPRGEVAHWAISAGTCSKRDLGYSHKRDCAQGFAVIVVHPDGAWAPVFAQFDPTSETTTMGTWRYRP